MPPTLLLSKRFECFENQYRKRLKYVLFRSDSPYCRSLFVSALNPTPPNTARPRIYWVIMLSLTIALTSLVFYFALPLLKQIVKDKVIGNPMNSLSSEEKEEVYRLLAEDLAGIYDSVPDGDVGKLLQRNIDKTQRGARVRTNNAGFRDDRPYGPKPADTFRIVCLGDSFVEGTGGRVEDRFCSQIEQIINQNALLGKGVSAEAYAIGIGSWTAVNAASYMISHLSDYDPDLIIVMMVSNDIADGQGVTGIGMTSNAFSPERRTFGSGVFSAAVAVNFGEGSNFLKFDLGPESAKRWNKAFSRYKRLEDLQQQRGNKMIFSVLDTIPFFSQQARKYHAKFEMGSSFLTTNYFPDADTSLPHDVHPNREGHRRIANHYLHAMAKEGWIDDPGQSLPPLHEGLRLDTSASPDFEYLDETRHVLVQQNLPEEINFNDLGAMEIQSFLGGIWPHMARPQIDRRQTYPSGSIKTGFYLRKIENAERLEVQIFVPQKEELFPNRIQLFVNGKPAHTLGLDSVDQFGKQLLSADLSRLNLETDVLEVVITSETYWSTIEDNTMRSYQLKRAYQSPE